MDGKDEYTEPTGTILAHVAEAGHSVSVHQLERWQGAGLIPRPYQKPLGRSRGTQTLYPTGTAKQVLALCQISKQHRPAKRRAWELWWQGFPVDEKYWRPVLQGAVETFDRTTRKARDVDGGVSDKALDAIETISDPKKFRSARLTRQIRKWVGAEKLQTLMGFLTRTAIKGFDGVEEYGEDRENDLAILRKLGDRGDYEGVLSKISAAIPNNLKLLIAPENDAEIFRWRDCLREIINICLATENYDEFRSDIKSREIYTLGLFADEAPEIRALFLISLISVKDIFCGNSKRNC